jgi:hypothetical protein
MDQEGPDEFARRVMQARDRVAPRFPDIDPGDLLLIVESVLRPPSKNRRFFVRPLPRGGGYVP